MSDRKKIFKGEHQSRTRKSNNAWGDAAVARNTKVVRELVNNILTKIKEGNVFYEDDKLFPKKKGVVISEANIQSGNGKLGHVVYSVSLPPVLYCGNCKCCKNDCYDLRHDVTQPQCRIYRAANAAVFEYDRKNYFDSISRQCSVIRFLRWHIGGDIVDSDYLDGMVRVARENEHCKFLAFTKMFDVVNDYISKEGDLPGNLKVIFSAWPGLEMPNPHNLPVAFPVFAEGDEEGFMRKMPLWYWHCGNDCTECAFCEQGCWNLKKGESVGFPLH